MTRYRKKPVVIDAWPVDWILNSARSNNPVFHSSPPFDAYMDGTVDIRAAWIVVHTLEGAMRGDRGDMLIRGVQGEWYPCKGDIFDATYEQADEDDPADSADFRA